MNLKIAHVIKCKQASSWTNTLSFAGSGFWVVFQFALLFLSLAWIKMCLSVCVFVFVCTCVRVAWTRGCEHTLYKFKFPWHLAVFHYSNGSVSSEVYIFNLRGKTSFIRKGWGRVGVFKSWKCRTFFWESIENDFEFVREKECSPHSELNCKVENHLF
jgi:hypothetical protein